jgi:hypothetical protein
VQLRADDPTPCDRTTRFEVQFAGCAVLDFQKTRDQRAALLLG